MRRLTFVLLVYFSRPPPQFWLLDLHLLEFLVLLPWGILQLPLALGLVVQVDFIVITVIEMDMTRLNVLRRRGSRLSLAEVGILYGLNLNIMIHRRYSCCFDTLPSLHLLELLVLLVLPLLP
jgi:hypothetical protein